MKKVVTVSVLILLAFALELGFKAVRLWPGHTVTVWGSTPLLTQVQNLRELVTVKYVLEKVVQYNDTQWYWGGDSRVLFVAHGVVKAGIDLSALKDGDIDVRDKSVRLNLPPPHITDVYLDDHRSEVVERSTGLLRTFDKDLESKARVIAVDDLRRAAEKNGILNDARERAHLELGALLSSLGFTNVNIRDK